jgi:hypothetical protein
MGWMPTQKRIHVACLNLDHRGLETGGYRTITAYSDVGLLGIAHSGSQTEPIRACGSDRLMQRTENGRPRIEGRRSYPTLAVGHAGGRGR